MYSDSVMLSRVTIWNQFRRSERIEIIEDDRFLHIRGTKDEAVIYFFDFVMSLNYSTTDFV